jgi:formylmethanofuran dehydrogenase subunit D
VLVYTEEYEPLALSEGDSTYFDSTMGHAVVSTSKDDALVLWVCVAL